MLPSAYVMMRKLPLTAVGKIDYRALSAHVPNDDVPNQADTLPRDIIEFEVEHIFKDVLKLKHFGLRDSFFAHGGHSLLALSLLNRLEARFGVKISLSMLLPDPKIERVAEIVRSQRTGNVSSPLVHLRSGAVNRPFFCVHPVSGIILCYLQLARLLNSNYGFCALQAPGVDGDAEPISNLSELASYFIDFIRSAQPTGPYMLGGHSFGGIVAFEMACQLQKEGHEVALLGIFDSPAPARFRGFSCSDWSEAKWVSQIARVLARFTGKDLSVDENVIAMSLVQNQLGGFIEQLIEAEVLPPGTDRTFITNLVTTSRAHLSGLTSYKPRVFSGNVVLFRATSLLPQDFVGSSIYDGSLESTLGWEENIVGTIAVEKVPGDHITMLGNPHVQVLAERLQGYLR